MSVNIELSNRGWIAWVVNPASITLIAVTVVIVSIILGSGGDPLELARLGSRFAEGRLDGTEGYDGQFMYYIARNPKPEAVAPLLDVPAYRYQRILMPVVARYLAFGRVEIIPWTLAIVGIISHTLGTWAVSRLLEEWGVSRWYSLVYGLWVGFVLAIRLDLPEPLAFGLIALGLLAYWRGRSKTAWMLFSLALFAKEVTIFFLLAMLAAEIIRRNWSFVSGLALSSIVPYAVFQIWLAWVFGDPGIGSGGEMATSFEILPFGGLLRIGIHSLLYLMAMSVVFVPSVVLPSIWGVWVSMKKLFANETGVIVFALFLNALIIPFLPFSTFRETGGLLRFASGLVMAILLFSGYYGIERPLRLSWLWLVLNVFLLKA